MKLVFFCLRCCKYFERMKSRSGCVACPKCHRAVCVVGKGHPWFPRRIEPLQAEWIK